MSLFITGCGLLPKPRPSVLFLVVDALRSDHLGFAGYSRPTSPCLDALAEGGAAFTAATAQAPFTMTSVPSLLSGRYPGSTFRWTSTESGGPEREWAVVIGEGVGLLPSLLGRRGWATGAFVTNPVVSGQILGIRDQFDHFDDRLKDRWTLDSAERLNQMVQEWVTSVGDTPWFCYLHYMDVHDPYYPPVEFATPFTELYHAFPEPSMAWMKDRLAQGGPTYEELGHLIAMYDGEIAYLDHQICALLDSLSALSRRHDLLVVVAADHGEEFLEHGGLGHGQSLYQELLRCPLIFWWPGHVPAGRIVRSPVGNVDIVPTILDLLDIPRPAGIEGVSLLPALRGHVSSRPVFSQTQGFSIQRGRWKLWHQPGGKTTLFDLVADSLETEDLASAFPETVSSLEEEMSDWHGGLRRPAMPPSLAGPVDIDPATMRLLRQLGYVQ